MNKTVPSRCAMSAMTFDSSPFPVVKLVLYSACSSGGGGGGGGRIAFGRWGVGIFVAFVQSIGLNQLFCNLHDL